MTTDYHSLIRTGSYINGKWLQNQNTFSVKDKANQSVIAELADANTQDMENAIDSATDAFESWSALTGTQRSHYLKAWFVLLQQHKEELATILTLEQGKPLAEAAAEIEYGAGYVNWFAEEATRIEGDILSGSKPGQVIHVVKKPVGVVGAVTPWNFPNAMIARKAAAALAAGCTFVVRPAAETPLSALALAVLAEQAGIPAGVFNVVTGTDAKSLGKVITQSPQVAKFSFTGSTAVGRQLMADCASTVKRLSMELGGNAPFIVFDDADLEQAVRGAMISKFRNSGQTCVCANRFVVHSVVHDAFVKGLKSSLTSYTLGHGLDGVDMGPMISAKAAEKVHNLVQDAVKNGATCVLGGNWNGGAFYPPTIITNVTDSMAIFHQEIFGPVVSISTFDNEAQAIEIANKTEYGLASYFYSNDFSRVQRVAQALNFGMVGINEGAISNPVAPFGGVKQSGFGREGSKYGLDDYLSIQYRCVGGI